MSETVNYGDGRQLQAGWVTTDQVPLAGPDTYYPGMELEYDATNDEYIALVTDANVAAIYNGEEQTLTADGFGDCIMAGEINESGLVDASNVAKTLTEDQRATRRNRNFYIKRV